MLVFALDLPAGIFRVAVYTLRGWENSVFR